MRTVDEGEGLAGDVVWIDTAYAHSMMMDDDTDFVLIMNVVVSS